MSEVKNRLSKYRAIKTVPTVLTLALLAILSTNMPVYPAHGTPTYGTWTIEASRPVAAEGLGATNVGSTIFAIGGNSAIAACHNDAYDASANSWTTKSSPPICVAEPAVVSVAGLVYVIGGTCEAGACTVGTEQSTVQVYNPTTDTWSVGADIPTPRSRAGVTVHNHMIFVIGGYKDSTTYNVVEVYDTVQNSWTSAAPMPTAREGLLAATVGDNIFAIGGFKNAGNFLTATGVVEEYDISTNSWITGLAQMPTARGMVNAMGGIACGNNPVFVIGGQTMTGMATNANEAYIPSLNHWIERPMMPTARGNGGTGIVGSQLFVIGGGMPPGTSLVTSENEAFQCSNTVAGDVSALGMPVSEVEVAVSNGPTLIGKTLTDSQGFYDIDLPAPGIYTLSATIQLGLTVSATVYIPPGTVVVQSLSA